MHQTMTAEQLKRLRKRLGMTQAAVAAELGVTRELVTAWENGRTRIRAIYLKPLRALAEKGAAA